jgi:hypothetical protein
MTFDQPGKPEGGFSKALSCFQGLSLKFQSGLGIVRELRLRQLEITA